MTREELKYAAETLIHSVHITGGDNPKYLPNVFIVGGHCFWFLNAARRAAYNTNLPIYVLTIESAWAIHYGINGDNLQKESVAWDFDQTGDTFNGSLFCDNARVHANTINNAVIKI